MSARVRVLLGIVLVVVALYFVIAQPDGSASAVRAGVSAVVSAFGSIFRFFQGVFSPGLGS